MQGVMINELHTEDEIKTAYKVIKQLRSHLKEQEYLALVKEAQEKENYKMVALIVENEIIAVIGFQPMITLYYGKFIWVCDLVTDYNHRSLGYGKQLLSYLHQWAKDNDYESIALSSGLQREDAHRFYEEKMNYDKVSYVFKAPL
ncbi:GNAT family N-acetyltransferase [Gracilibacillus dipsosauri]|nr:GNAT family N-acetyltransferase [Gracilibacillus dipsosauri]